MIINPEYSSENVLENAEAKLKQYEKEYQDLIAIPNITIRNIIKIAP